MYESVDDLPDTVRDILPPEAQEVYLEAFNESWERYEEAHTSELNQEAYANRDAWTAVKREYTRDDETGEWYPAGEVPEHGEEEEEGGILDTLADVV